MVSSFHEDNFVKIIFYEKNIFDLNHSWLYCA